MSGDQGGAEGETYWLRVPHQFLRRGLRRRRRGSRIHCVSVSIVREKRDTYEQYSDKSRRDSTSRGQRGRRETETDLDLLPCLLDPANGS